jgi:hypothetical protein
MTVIACAAAHFELRQAKRKHHAGNCRRRRRRRPRGAHRSLLSDPKSCVWLNWLPAIAISHHEKNGPG